MRFVLVLAIIVGTIAFAHADLTKFWQTKGPSHFNGSQEEYKLEQSFIQLLNEAHKSDNTKPIGSEKEWYNQYRFQKRVDAVTGRMNEAVEERIEGETERLPHSAKPSDLLDALIKVYLDAVAVHKAKHADVHKMLEEAHSKAKTLTPKELAYMIGTHRWDHALEIGVVDPNIDAAWDSLEEAAEYIAGQGEADGISCQTELKLLIKEESGRHSYAHGVEYSQIPEKFKLTAEMNPNHEAHATHTNHATNFKALVNAVADLWK